mmetsp:Transcript_23000/g.34266  ORF Transcript_23000/g.34266 Transcript_23000/m.34266 type:complete len:567 (-) Transcript_23000:233-1933(-)
MQQQEYQKQKNNASEEELKEGEESRSSHCASYSYIDYCYVPPTQDDLDSYGKRLSYYYYTTNNHANSARSSSSSQQRGAGPQETTNITTLTRTRTHGSTSKQTKTQGEEEEIQLLFDPQIFNRLGSGNVKKKSEIDSSTLCLFPSKGTGLDFDFYNHCHHQCAGESFCTTTTAPDNFFVGFMGTNFPARLHDLISRHNSMSSTCLHSTSSTTNTSTAQYDQHHTTDIVDPHNVISWLPHGRSWIVRDTTKFIKSIAVTHFNCSVYKSFIRQVNGWGFKRIASGLDKGSYYHPLFLRDMPHLTKWMKRHESGVADSSTTSSTSLFPHSTSELLTHYERKTKFKIEDKSDHPDFYAMNNTHPIPNHYAALKNKIYLSIIRQHKKNEEDLRRAATGKEDVTTRYPFRDDTIQGPQSSYSRRPKTFPQQLLTELHNNVLSFNNPHLLNHPGPPVSYNNRANGKRQKKTPAPYSSLSLRQTSSNDEIYSFRCCNEESSSVVKNDEDWSNNNSRTVHCDGDIGVIQRNPDDSTNKKDAVLRNFLEDLFVDDSLLDFINNDRQLGFQEQSDEF